MSIAVSTIWLIEITPGTHDDRNAHRPRRHDAATPVRPPNSPQRAPLTLIMAAAKSAVVIGGGFVGLSCALHLQRIGRRVVLVDRGSVGGAQSASYGNAGTMACYANVPTNSPSLFRKLPGMLLDPSSPLSVRVSSHLVSMMPRAALFAWHCRPSAVEKTADALGALLARAEAGYEPVWKQAGIDIDGPMGEHASGDECAIAAVRGAQRLLIAAAHRGDDARVGGGRGAAPPRSRRRPKMEALTADEVLALGPALGSCGRRRRGIFRMVGLSDRGAARALVAG